MEAAERIRISVYDYRGNNLCDQYDSEADISGQAADIYLTSEKNGWKEQSFTIPSTVSNADGDEENFRLAYQKNEYRVLYQEGDAKDWYILSEPKVVHSAFSKNVDVTCGHISQQLKMKKIGFVMDDENGIGTCSELAEVILAGTGWTQGVCDIFYEADSTTEKVRTQTANGKEGAYKLIANLCNLFNAKPYYNGNEKTVDIRAINPFAGVRPDANEMDRVIELRYGNNVKNITRTLDTSNLITRQNVEGTYGEDGYVGIDEAKHKVFTYTAASAQAAGAYGLTDGSRAAWFTLDSAVNAGTVIVCNFFDAASSSYVTVTDGDTVQYLPASKSGIGTQQTAVVTEEENMLTSVMDFSYFRSIGLFTDEDLSAVAAYQNSVPAQRKEYIEVSTEHAKKLTTIAELVGTCDFCICDANYVSSNTVNYTQEYSTTSEKTITTGDKVVAQKTTQIGENLPYCMSTVKSVTDTQIVTHFDVMTEGIEKQIVFFDEPNGIIGGKEAAVEAAIEEAERVAKYSFYFQETAPVITEPTAYWFNPEYSAQYFVYNDGTYALADDEDTPVLTSIGLRSMGLYYGQYEKYVHTVTTSQSTQRYGFEINDKAYTFLPTSTINIGDMFTYDRQGFLKWTRSNDTSTTLDVTTTSKVTPTVSYNDLSYEVSGVANGLQEQMVTQYNTASSAYGSLKTQIETQNAAQIEAESAQGNALGDMLREGSWQDDNYIDGQEAQLYADAQVNLGTQSWPQADYDVSFIGLRYADDYDAFSQVSITYDYNRYVDLAKYTHGELAAYTYDQLRNDRSLSEGETMEGGQYILSDTDGQSVAFVETDEGVMLSGVTFVNTEDGTYMSGAQYTRSNVTFNRETYNITAPWPLITIDKYAHIIDEEIKLNAWGYFDKIQRCIDVPSKTKISVSTDDSNITAHSFSDILSRIADVADEVKGKTSQYERAKAISGSGQQAADALNGAIDVQMNKILSGMSNWYTMDDGSIIFESQDGTSAMKLTGQGFMIANGKIRDGVWNWRTFGTGEGFTADLITTGALRAGMVTILGTEQFYWDANNLYIFDVADTTGGTYIAIGQYDGTNYGIGYTQDGGETFQTAIGFDGVKLSAADETRQSDIEVDSGNLRAEFTEVQNSVANKASISDIEDAVAESETRMETAWSNDITASAQQQTVEIEKRQTAQQVSDAISGEVTPIEERLDAAEQKIAPDAIVTTVTSSTTYTNDLSEVKSNAVSEANANTANQLANYSTTAQMNSAINQSADSITSSVSATYATKTQAQGYADTAENNANAATNAKLESYSTITQTSNSIALAVADKVTQDDINTSIAAIDEFHNTTVDISATGVAIKTGGTFTVESQKFDINESGEMSAVNARISGQVSVNGNDVWHKGILVVSSVAPSNPVDGMIWVKPDASGIAATGTWTHDALTSRPWENPYNVALSGQSIGAAPSNATYTYTVSVPVFYSWNGSGTITCTVYLGASEGAQTINMGNQSFSESGDHIYTATVTSSRWLGNSGTIYMKISFSSGAYMSVNSHEAFSCTLTAKSSSAGTGWLPCAVQMYMS